MSNRIITISREFGSGGRTIGRLAAQKLGVACYDQELIDKIAQESGLFRKYVEEHAEDARGWMDLVSSHDYYGRSVGDKLFSAQTKVIRELADKESCVIVGRCADYILGEYDNVLKVFIHASMDKRAERIVNQYGERTEAPIQRLKEKDRKRRAYYQMYTDRRWGAMENYHVALDSGVVGIERCAEIIAGLY